MTENQRPTVLVATDLGEWGDLAVREADRWARETNSRLAVLHCVPIHAPIAPLFAEVGRADESELERLQRAAGETLEAHVHALTGRDPSQYDAVIAAGTPYVEIVRAAEERRAALVVVGARGVSGLMRLLVGHSAEKVARFAHCPVLVVRPTPRSGRVLAATDLSAPATLALRVAHRIARQREALLSALYVIDTAVPYPIDGAMLSMGTIPVAIDLPPVESLRARAGEQLRAHLTEVDVVAEPLVADGTVQEALVATARTLPAELVVVGTVGRTCLARVVLGSTAELAIRELPCSVLVVR